MTFCYRPIQTHGVAHEAWSRRRIAELKNRFYQAAAGKNKEISVMKIQKTTRITIEEENVRIVSVGRGRIASGLCEACGTTRTVLSREMASTVLQVSCLEIDRLIESGRIHIVEIRDGSELICGHSLSGIDADPDRSQGNKTRSKQ